MRKLAVSLGIAGVLLAGCGGDGGVGVDRGGFYSLYVLLTSGSVHSPASRLSGGLVEIPPDTIEGEVTLSYEGSLTNPLTGGIQRALLCIESDCFTLGISGLLRAGQTIPFSVSINAYKFLPPWVVLNPFEDEVVEENILSDTLSSGVQNANTVDNYYNSQRTVYLSNYPIVQGSLQMSASGEFQANTVYTGYDSSMGTVVVNLVMGTNTANSVVPSSFVADAGGKICTDDGAGNIVGTDCSGTIDYTNGTVRIAINNITTPTDLNMTYRVNGSQTCWDDGAGNLAGDCSGTINYSTGELVYSFRFDFTSVPTTVSIDYQYQTGTTDGMHYYYTLPADTTDPNNPHLYIRYGNWIGVYQGSTLLCDTDGNGSLCTINKNGRSVEVVFSSPQTASLTIKFSEQKKYDFNPSIDARAYNHLWNGQSSAIVDATVVIEVRLEDGTVLTASSPLTLYAVPQ